MKTIINSFLLAFILFTLQACSGITVSQDYEQGYDFSKLKTFSWKPHDGSKQNKVKNELVDKRIRKAILNNMAAKQFKLIDSGTPDFYISYHVTVKQKIRTDNVSGGVTIGRSSHGRYGGVGFGTGSQVSTYDQGTLLIDVTEVSNNKLVWRGISTQAVAGHSDPQKSTAVINETVEKMLMQFPPTK